MKNATTEAMEFASKLYAEVPTFGTYDPTAAMIVGCMSDEWLRGIRLAAQLRLNARQAVVTLRAEARQ